MCLCRVLVLHNYPCFAVSRLNRQLGVLLQSCSGRWWNDLDLPRDLRYVSYLTTVSGSRLYSVDDRMISE
jgi:hypothetical protein